MMEVIQEMEVKLTVEERREKHAAYMRQWRADHPDRSREIVRNCKERHDGYRHERRESYRINHHECLDKMRQWRKENHEAIYSGKKEWKRFNREKCNAHHIVWLALASGEIKKQEECSMCGAVGKTQAHHNDYSRPKDVIWVCSFCHAALHAQTNCP